MPSTTCDTTSSPFGEGKISTLKIMLKGTFSGLQEVVGEAKLANEEVVAAAQHTFWLCMANLVLSHWNQPVLTSSN